MKTDEGNKIIEGNKLIAEFDNYEQIPEGINEKFWKYHALWDWLMPVVKKCKEVCLKITGYGFNSGSLQDALIEVNIKKVWLAVVEFIKWYKEVKTAYEILDDALTQYNSLKIKK